MRPRAPCSTGPCSAAWAFTYKNFDPAVAGPALGGVIGGDRVSLAHAIDRNTAASTRNYLTARSIDNGLLMASLPVLSVWPTMRTSVLGLLRRPSANWSSTGAKLG